MTVRGGAPVHCGSTRPEAPMDHRRQAPSPARSARRTARRRPVRRARRRPRDRARGAAAPTCRTPSGRPGCSSRIPSAIVRAHLAFFRAGARSRPRPATRRRSRASPGAASTATAAARAHAAGASSSPSRRGRSRSPSRPSGDSRGDDRPLLVAASVGPYGAFLADGSEYRGRYGLSVAALRDFHRASDGRAPRRRPRPARDRDDPGDRGGGRARRSAR